jgi:hypothetical protein
MQKFKHPDDAQPTPIAEGAKSAASKGKEKAVAAVAAPAEDEELPEAPTTGNKANTAITVEESSSSLSGTDDKMSEDFEPDDI